MTMFVDHEQRGACSGCGTSWDVCDDADGRCCFTADEALRLPWIGIDPACTVDVLTVEDD